MAGPLIYDRVCETTTTTGTGTLTLLGAVTGYQTFSVVGNSNTAFYTIEAIDGNGLPTGDYEVGIGTYTTSGTTLARTKILASSNAGAAVNLAAGTKRVFLSVPSAALTNDQPCNGRLTLTSGLPVNGADVATATTIYFSPHLGNRIALWNGSMWVVYAFSELSLALGTLTSDKNYDVFCYDNAGTLTLEFSAAWSSDTARTDALALQDGVYCKSGALTRRYLGTFRTISTTQTCSFLGNTHQAGGKRFLWNAYNQVPLQLSVIDTTGTVSYSTAAWRQYNAATGNKVEYVQGLTGYLVEAHVVSTYGDTSGNNAYTNIGVDSTTTASGHHSLGYLAYGAQHAHHAFLSSLGYHYLAWLEWGGTGVQHFAASGGTGGNAGLTARIWG